MSSRYPDPFGPDGYPFLEEAAAEARGMSRRWWAKGGAADRRFPVIRPMLGWPEPGTPAPASDEAALRHKRRMAGRVK